MTRCIAAVALAGLIPCVAQAQQNAAANEANRNRTRAYVEEVTADRPGELDRARSLGETLHPALADRSAVERAAARRQPAKARQGDESALRSLLAGVGKTQPPPAARLVKRVPAPASAAQDPVFTPDFSRQVSSFAQLIGRDILDLPISVEVAAKRPDPVPSGETWALPDIVAEGLAYSPVYRQSQALSESSSARRQQALADLMPSLSTRVARGIARTGIEGKAEDLKTDQYRTSVVRLIQPVYDHVAWNNLFGANAAQRATLLRTDASREAVSLSVFQASVSVITARIAIEFAEEQENDLRGVLRYLEDRAQSGAASLSDLERARTRVLAAQQQRIDQQATYKSALFELERLIGIAPKAMHLPLLNQLPPLPQTQGEIRTLALNANADLKALEADVEAQRATVSAQYGKMLPALSLSAEHDIQDNTQGPTAFQRDKRLLAVLAWSLNLGGKEIHAGREAAAELRNRIAKYDEEKKRVEQGIEADFSQLQSATQRIATGESEQRAAQQVVGMVRDQLKLGRMGSLLEALDAFDRLYAARIRTGQALSQQMIAQAQLLRRMGMLSRLGEGARVPEIIEQGAAPAASAATGAAGG